MQLTVELNKLILQNHFMFSFCKSPFPHRSVNLSCITNKVDGFVRELTFAKRLDKHFSVRSKRSSVTHAPPSRLCLNPDTAAMHAPPEKLCLSTRETKCVPR